MQHLLKITETMQINNNIKCNYFLLNKFCELPHGKTKIKPVDSYSIHTYALSA